MEEPCREYNSTLTNNILDNNRKFAVLSRSFGLDLTRAFAIFAVIGGHFFSIHTEFRNSPLTDLSMLMQGIAQSVLGCGVPLFIMLTGYLNVNKTPNKKYYSGIWRVLQPIYFSQ